MYPIAEKFNKVFDLTNWVRITKLKNYQYRSYGVKNSDHQIEISPIPTESQFIKFKCLPSLPAVQYIIPRKRDTAFSFRCTPPPPPQIFMSCHPFCRLVCMDG